MVASNNFQLSLTPRVRQLLGNFLTLSSPISNPHCLARVFSILAGECTTNQEEYELTHTWLALHLAPRAIAMDCKRQVAIIKTRADARRLQDMLNQEIADRPSATYVAPVIKVLKLDLEYWS